MNKPYVTDGQIILNIQIVMQVFEKQYKIASASLQCKVVAGGSLTR